MPAHSLAAARGVRTQISIENSHRHEHPRSMNYGKRGSTRCRCPTSVPAERCSSHSGWPGRVHQKRSGNDPRRVRLPATEPRQTIAPPCSPPGHESRNSLRTMTRCGCGSSPHFRSPIFAACFAESAISVNGDGGRWWLKLAEGGLGALGEILTRPLTN
jgi:hypothetical protein